MIFIIAHSHFFSNNSLELFDITEALSLKKGFTLRL